jgi:hypothetical protein
VLKPEMPPDIPADVLAASEQPIPMSAVLVGTVTIGLIPGDASSVAPSGIPVGPTDVRACKPAEMPSGEVAATPGVGMLDTPT